MLPRTFFSDAQTRPHAAGALLRISGVCLSVLALVLLMGRSQAALSAASAGAPLWPRTSDANVLVASAAGSPSALGYGETILGSILSAGEIDTYTFAANAGDKVLVRMTRTSGDLVLQVRLFDPGGTKLCEASNAYPAEIASCALPSTGTYSILAGDLLGTRTGDYALYIQRLNNPGNTAAIAFGQTLPGSLSPAVQMDTYTFGASAGDKVLVRMTRTSGDLVLQVRLYGPDGAKLCEATNAYPAEIASCTVPSTGTYTILAGDLLGIRTGDYTLYIQRLNNPGNTAAIAFGLTLPGSLSPAVQMDTYTFGANAGDKVLVRMTRTSGDLVLQVRLYGPDGVKLCEATNAYPAEIATCTLPSTGTYSILAGDLLGIRTGDYTLYIQRLNSPGSPTPIAFCQTLTGSISPAAQMDTYTFAANTGDKVLVRMTRTSGDLVLQVRLYGPDGVKLCEAYNAYPAEIASCTLPSTGTYTILAGDLLGIRTGDYTLYIQRLNSPGCSETPTPTPTATATQMPTATATPTRTSTPTPTRTSTPSQTQTSAPTPTRTATPTPTRTSIATQTRTPTPTPTRTRTGTPTRTPTSTVSPAPGTPTPTGTRTRTPTATSTTGTPTATGAPTITPTTTTPARAPQAYLPIVIRTHPPAATPTPTVSLLPDAPVLSYITPPAADPTYTIRWPAAARAESYVLERATSPGFGDAIQVHEGAATDYVESSTGIATYHYRVKARNEAGDSAWSNVQAVAVRWEREPNGDVVDATGVMQSGLRYYGVLAGASDQQDYFYFELATSRNAELWLTNMASGQDFNLVLRDATLGIVGYSGQAGNADEHIAITALAAGRYYLQVRRVTGDSSQPYHVRGVW